VGAKISLASGSGARELLTQPLSKGTMIAAAKTAAQRILIIMISSLFIAAF
jgi:hypothetical protein